MSVSQGIGELPQDADGVGHRQLWFTSQTCAKRLTVDVRHHIEQSVTGRPGID
jgi:hypothetical protein